MESSKKGIGRRIAEIAGFALFAVACLIVTAVVLVSAQGRRMATTNTANVNRVHEPTTEVRGRATYEDTGKPVRRAKVMLFSLNGRGEPASVTNLDGEFRIEGVQAGTYVVYVSSPGVLSPFSYIDISGGRPPDGAAALSEARKHFDEIFVDGKTPVTVNPSAKRGGVLSGRVTYSDGEPAINAIVSVSRKVEGKFQRIIVPRGAIPAVGISTDDRGAYRIAGLPPGEYLISVAEMNTRNRGRSAEEGEIYEITGLTTALAYTFYPSERSSKTATSINLEAGQEIKDLDITVLDRGAHMLSGIVVDQQSRIPLKNVEITLTSREKTANVSMGVRETSVSSGTAEDGSWLIEDVPDGTYSLKAVENEEYVEREEGKIPQPKPRHAQKSQVVTVSGADVSSVTIELLSGGRISGKVIVEGEKDGDHFIPLAIEWKKIGSDEQGTDGPSDREMRFSLTGLSAGKYVITAKSYGNTDYYMKSITAGGKDLRKSPIELTEGGIVDNVVIVLSLNPAKLTGHVTNSEKQAPVRGAEVVLVPADSEMWGYNAGYLFAVTNGDGVFEVEGGPGDYIAIVLKRDEGRQSVTQQFVKERASVGQRVSIKAGVENKVEIVVP
jgi:5-hydroxyisourate hydrolase-like protein (transthyretin family)